MAEQDKDSTRTGAATADPVRRFAQRLLDSGLSDISPRDRRVIEKIARRNQVARDINAEFEGQLTFGERLADKVAEVGGSWTFIISFGGFIVVWAGLNSVLLLWGGAFDPYPFVFLNLLLSLLAAVQAPVIMMSQNRQADKDRLAAAHDYEVNLKSELEIMALHDKLDQLRQRDLVDMLARIETLVRDLQHDPGRPGES
ncbi:DUF1003 domain-containing protein [Segnochrobactraceae bacterium EtOH-i3]